MPVCDWCRIEFRGTKRARYCSTRHRVAAFRERNRNQDASTLRGLRNNLEGPRGSNGTIAALYIQSTGIYTTLEGVDPWDIERDATDYPGPFPVVAHPPCGPWGHYRHTCTGQRADLAVRAVAQVRQWGGVLEHPCDSHLWKACELPEPGGTRDRFGGWTILIRQSWWGHLAPKRTWLYIAGRIDVPELPDPCEDPGGRVKNMSRAQREATPPELARWLVKLARGCGRPVFRKEGYPSIVSAAQSLPLPGNGYATRAPGPER